MSTLFNQQRRRVLCLLGLALPFVTLSTAYSAAKPRLKLATNYSEGLPLSDYLVSEKYDGVRVFWNGETLLSRAGNTIRPPAWWLSVLPDTPLDGELWIARGEFSELNGLLKKKTANDQHWKKVKFLIFDVPDNTAPFHQRYSSLKNIVERIDTATIKLVEQQSVADQKALMAKLDTVIDGGGEGLMLQQKSSYYVAGRNAGLIKLKRWQDAEAVVIGATSGRGKYIGVMGALVVETPEGIRFKIGSGFSDAERADPPELGDMVTYRYSGKSKSGVPRFASFIRVRD